MIIVESKAELQRWRQKQAGLVGFVPTMGALHVGHMSLVNACRMECHATAVSIFVNPTQFGPHEDFNRYPRPIEADAELCERAGVDLLYRPAVAEMYPPGSQTMVEPGAVAQRWCGAARPGHFRGVCTIVLKLLNQVAPHRTYLGEKDAQQLRVLRQMAADLDVATEIVGCPTTREEDGLALSSRNRYLSVAERVGADALFRGMRRAQQQYQSGITDVATLEKEFRTLLSSEGGWALEYAAIVDENTLEPLTVVGASGLFLVAARRGATRLIDNMVITRPQ